MLSIIFRGHSDAGFFARGVGLRPGKSPVTLLPGNQRTNDARYACIVVLRDFPRMRRETAEKKREWHYSQLESDILGDIRAGRAVLVFDLSNEGPSYDPAVFSEMYSWIEENQLPPGRCIWMAQNRAVALAAKTHAGARADLLRFVYYDYFVKVIAWMFSSSNRDSVLGADHEAMIGRLFDANRKEKLLLCLNATPRLPRVLTMAALHYHQLIADSIVSFPGMQYVKKGVSLAEVLNFICRNPSLDYLRPSIEAVGSMPALKVDAFNEQGNALVTKIDLTLYERSFFSLVTESDFSDGRIDRVTEKTAKAYCMGHPALIVGNAHAVRFMTDLGFQDWSDVVDRSAEAVLDPASRLELVMREVLRQASRIRSDPEAWVSGVREVGSYNVRHAVSGKFVAECVKNMDQRVLDHLLHSISR